MADVFPFPKSAELPAALGLLIIEAAEKMSVNAAAAFKPARKRRTGTTLRPGAETPLWNELRAQLAPHLRHYGDQATLARLLNLPRQRVHDFIAGGKMPDAERTLQLLAWLMAAKRNRRPL